MRRRTLASDDDVAGKYVEDDVDEGQGGAGEYDDVADDVEEGGEVVDDVAVAVEAGDLLTEGGCGRREMRENGGMTSLRKCLCMKGLTTRVGGRLGAVTEVVVEAEETIVSFYMKTGLKHWTITIKTVHLNL